MHTAASHSTHQSAQLMPAELVCQADAVPACMGSLSMLPDSQCARPRLPLKAPALTQVLHMEFDLAGSGMRFAPGDSLGLLPANEARLVDALLKRLGWDAGQAFAVRSADGADGAARLLAHLRWPCTLQDALLYGCDVTSVPRCARGLCTCLDLALVMLA